MTAATNKLGSDMTDDEIKSLWQDINNAYGRAGANRETSVFVQFARALLARQPAAIDKQEAAMRDRARRFLSEFVRQTGISMSDHVQEVMLNLFLRYAAPPAKEASKPAAPSVEQDERGGWDGDSEESRTAFRDCDSTAEPISLKTPWQIWRDACAWQARAASTSANVAQGAEAVAGEPIPNDCDVRKILLRVEPGDGRGHEVYARNVAEVEELLSSMGERLEDIRGAAPPAQTALTDDARDAIRYRWMRDFNVRCKDGVNVAPPCEHVFASLYSHAVGTIPATRLIVGEELDRTIDAALTAAQPAIGDTE